MRNYGMGLSEILVTLLIISIARAGFSKLMLANIKSSSYSNTQQLVSNGAQYIFDRINANLQSGSNNQSSPLQIYTETSYTSDTTVPSVTCNSGSYCTQQQQAFYDLYQWKQYLATLKIPYLSAIVCQDTRGNYGVPTLSSPNCSGSGDLVVKIVWQYVPPSVESSLVSSTKYLITKLPVINTVSVYNIMGNSAIVNSMTNGAFDIFVNSSGMIYYVVNDSQIYSWYTCLSATPSLCSLSGVSTSKISQFTVYDNTIPLYAISSDSTIYQCNNSECKSPTVATTGDTSIIAMYTISLINYAVTNKNVVYVNPRLDLSNTSYSSYVDYSSSTFLSGTDPLPTTTLSIGAFLKIPVSPTTDTLNTGVIYLGFSNGSVYADTLGGTINGTSYINVTHSIANISSPDILQNVVALAEYTNSISTYVIAANQNITTPNNAGLFYLDTNNVVGGWSAICTGLTNGNINSVSTYGTTAYFMVGGTNSSNSGMYSCDLSKIGS